VVLDEPDDIEKSGGGQITRELHNRRSFSIDKTQQREKMDLPLEVSEGPPLGSLVHIDQKERGGSCTEGQ
jgi:hypothetical protein